MIHDPDFYQKAIEKMFYIVNMDMKSVPFVLNTPQKKILHSLSNMDIILKARKEGVSSLVLAMFTVDFLTMENVTCAVISHEDKATQRLFDKVRYFLESMQKTWPGELPFKLKYNSRHEIVNTVKNSVFYIGTAGSRAFGRGDTINNVHISELAHWRNQEQVMTGLLQSVPKDGTIIIESTANGYGDYFCDLWTKSEDHMSGFKPHFLPWFDLSDYVYPVGTVPLELTEEEQTLINKYGLDREQISWRRWKIAQMGGDYRDSGSWDKFSQEYPSNPEEAFIMSGNPVWSPTLMRYYISHCKPPKQTGYLRGYDPVSIEPNEKAYLKIWKEPQEFHVYAIGVDVSEGKQVAEGGRERDASCAQVFDKTTYEQVAVWHGRIDPDQLGLQLDLLGRYYNKALIGVERNAMGLTPLIKLRDLNYPNLYYRERLGLITEKVTGELGWLTDNASKESLISDATLLLRDKRILLYDERTIAEMKSFVRDQSGHARAERGSYDDRVMAFLIGLRMLGKAKSINYSNQIEREDELESPDKGFWMQGQSFNSMGMPTHPDQMDGGFGGEEF